MCGEPPHQVDFKFYGSSVEAVLDKLPMTRVLEEKERFYTMKRRNF